MENIADLNIGEQFLIHAHRALIQFREQGYRISDFNILGKGDFYITLKNDCLKKEMTLKENSEGFLDLVIKKKGLFHKPKSFKDYSRVSYKGIYQIIDNVENNQDFMQLALK